MSTWPGDDGNKPEVYTTDNNEYTKQSLKKHGIKIFVKKRQVLTISREKETSVKIHTGRKDII